MIEPKRARLDFMLGKDYEGQDCAIARALEVIGERWTLLIVRDALYGVRRFSDFHAHLDVPKAVLSDRLTGLVEHGILERRPDPDHAGRSCTSSPPRVASYGRCCTRWSCGPTTQRPEQPPVQARGVRHRARRRRRLPGVRDHAGGRRHRHRAAPGARPASRRPGCGRAARPAPAARAARRRVIGRRSDRGRVWLAGCGRARGMQTCQAGARTRRRVHISTPGMLMCTRVGPRPGVRHVLHPSFGRRRVSRGVRRAKGPTTHRPTPSGNHGRAVPSTPRTDRLPAQ